MVPIGLAGESIEALRSRLQSQLLSVAPELPAVSSRKERRARVRDAVVTLLARDRVRLSAAEIARLAGELAESIAGFGPLEPLLEDPAITEIMVNGPRRIYVERNGMIEPSGVCFEDDAAVLHLIDRIVSPLGLRIDVASPWVDARLPDGSRVHAIVPPLAVSGPTLTIRRFPATPLSDRDLLAKRSVTPGVLALLRDTVQARRNLIVSGGAGAGKTTLLGVLCGLVPARERIVTIEDAAELRLARDHAVALEARPPNVEGRGEVTIRDLVRNALRMRPDRIVVGEVRGGEALDMLQAMNTGHAGSMGTAHANSPADLLVRLEAMALMGDVTLSVAAVRRQIASALDLVVHVERRHDGRRIVSEVAEVRSSGGDMETVVVYRADEAREAAV